MKRITAISLITIIFFSGCSNDTSTISQKDCIQEGKVLKIKRKLNYRTGEYENKAICINRAS